MRPIKISDLCELTGYSRDQMRGLLAELPCFAHRPVAARVARIYSNHDVMLVAVLSRLETVYGLKRSVVVNMSEPIISILTTPREVSNQAHLILRIRDAACEYVEGVPAIDDGLVVALAPIFLEIDSYLLPMPLVQRETGLSAANSPVTSTRATAPHDPQRGRRSHG